MSIPLETEAVPGAAGNAMAGITWEAVTAPAAIAVASAILHVLRISDSPCGWVRGGTPRGRRRRTPTASPPPVGNTSGESLVPPVPLPHMSIDGQGPES
ncbi:hypothetical protein GCM10018775_71890 [Streptomyces umbrinus]|nr:hypothetical protein GCM10018775_71890 [Streptomyces umbrinus]